MRFLPIALAAVLAVAGTASFSGTARADGDPPAAGADALGPLGHDAKGQPGRIHVVVPGDTLWDVSDAYLGTPWVWPSIWKDNDAIANPHLIYPGDRIWITPTEMRKVTPEEAAELLANQPQPAPALPASLGDALADTSPGPGRTYRYTQIETTGFVTQDRYEGAGTIVDSHIDRVWVGVHDEVIVGFGSGEVAVGDQFEIFRPTDRVVDPDTGNAIGWATQVLGWLEVNEVHEESATAIIRMSRSEARRGDYLLPRPTRTASIPIGPKPDVDGRIIHTPEKRTEMALTDVVYLDRGTADGLAVGSPLEVFRPIGKEFDELRGEERALPDEVVAKLIVVQAAPDASVAVVTHARKEINRGDVFRGSDSIGW
jgi:hypothetical protein